MSDAIRIEKLEFGRAAPGSVATRAVFADAIPGVAFALVSLFGPARWLQPQARAKNFVLLFMDGRGELRSGEHSYAIDGDTIVRAPMGQSMDVTVRAGDTLDFLCIRKEISEADVADMAQHPLNNVEPWVKRFIDCEPYREAIKSPKTINRTLLPAKVIARVALGTVETTGPDVVEEHRHPMLEQVLLGLRGNDIIVRADGVDARLGEFEMLLIPHASMHGARVEEGRKLHYIWMDFFTEKEGESWLEMHQPIT